MAREIDPCIGEYVHLLGQTHEADALKTLQKVASMVKPLMRARGWMVNKLLEFYPDDETLQGLNVNRGEQILLRLRRAHDKTQFLPVESVIDTMLHELSHIVHSGHDRPFMELWDQLRDEFQALTAKGYTGEGFLSQGYKLGGQRLPRHEMKRLARAAAEKRASEQSWIGTGGALGDGSGGTGAGGIRLGGAPMKTGADPRKVIARAAERRQKILKSCEGNAKSKSRAEIREMADRASRNGVSTRARANDEDEEMAQVWWDLVQEDQMREYGEDYAPPTSRNPAGRHRRGGKEMDSRRPSLVTGSSSPRELPTREHMPKVSRLEQPSSRESRPSKSSSSRDHKSRASPSIGGSTSRSSGRSNYDSKGSPRHIHGEGSRPTPGVKSHSSRDITRSADTGAFLERSRSATSTTNPSAGSDLNAARQSSARPISRLVIEDEAKKRNDYHEQARAEAPHATTRSSRQERAPARQELIDLTTPHDEETYSSSSRRPAIPSPSKSSWTCDVCTCRNPLTFLACDACGSMRGGSIQDEDYLYENEQPFDSRSLSSMGHASPAMTSPLVPSSRSNVAMMPPPRVQAQAQASPAMPRPSDAAAASVAGFWRCTRCSTRMETQWWTCERCGKMKESS